jgi:hypothetical protein
VAHQLSAEELQKAARNIAKIEGFFAARLAWTVEDDCLDAFNALKSTADRIAFTVGQKALASGVEAKLGGTFEVTQQPSEPFDKEHLKKLASFLGRLDRWFVDHASGGLEKGGRRRLAAIQESLESTRMALAEIELNQKPSRLVPRESSPTAAPGKTAEETPEKTPSSPKIAQRPASSAPADDVFAESKKRTEYIAAKQAEQLAFTNDVAEPMYEWVGSEKVKLTEFGREQLTTLFEEQGVTFYRYQLEKFADEIKMRIETAPA